MVAAQRRHPFASYGIAAVDPDLVIAIVAKRSRDPGRDGDSDWANSKVRCRRGRRSGSSQSESSSKRRARDECKRPVEGRSVDLAARAALVA